MGRQEEYRQELSANLKARGYTPSGKESIKQLEKQLKQLMESKRGR